MWMTFAWLHMSVASASFVELGTSPVTLLSYTFMLLGLHPMLEAQIQWLSAQLRICTKGLSWDGNERVLESVTSCKPCTAGNLFFIKNWPALISLQFNHLVRSSSMSKSLLVSCSVSIVIITGSLSATGTSVASTSITRTDSEAGSADASRCFKRLLHARYAGVPAMRIPFRDFFSGGRFSFESLSDKCKRFWGPFLFALDGQSVPVCLGRPLGFTCGLVLILLLRTDSFSVVQLATPASVCIEI